MQGYVILACLIWAAVTLNAAHFMLFPADPADRAHVRELPPSLRLILGVTLAVNALYLLACAVDARGIQGTTMAFLVFLVIRQIIEKVDKWRAEDRPDTGGPSTPDPRHFIRFVGNGLLYGAGMVAGLHLLNQYLIKAPGGLVRSLTDSGLFAIAGLVAAGMDPAFDRLKTKVRGRTATRPF